MAVDLTIEPGCAEMVSRLSSPPEGVLFGYSLREWREQTRRELGLATDRPIIATGHQTLLWHPGILAKYLLMDALVKRGGYGGANLIVDQHAGGYEEFTVPVRRRDGRWGKQTVRLTDAPRDIPMSRHDSFTPRSLPVVIRGATAEVGRGIIRGVESIHRAISAHQDAPNAAKQMAEGLWDLMSTSADHSRGGWVARVPDVTATELMETSLARSLLERMRDDPQKMAGYYNRAVSRFGGVGIGRLLIRDDYVETPLWRIREDGRRMHAYDNDLDSFLGGEDGLAERNQLMPRALFMTALVRLGMCDLFIHGTGGANYDRAMEQWIGDWLGVSVSPIAVATATLRLPLIDEIDQEGEGLNMEQAMLNTRRVWHNPECTVEDHQPGVRKAGWLRQIESLPFRSPQRRAAFYSLHLELGELRSVHRDRLQKVAERAEQVRRRVADAAIANRRDWAFPLYPREMINELAAAVGEHVRCVRPIMNETRAD